MWFSSCSCWACWVKGGQDTNRKKIKDINKKNQHLSTRCKTNLISAPGDCSLLDAVEAERERDKIKYIHPPLPPADFGSQNHLRPCDIATAPVSVGVPELHDKRLGSESHPFSAAALVVLRVKSLSNTTGNADSSPLLCQLIAFLFFIFLWILHAAREGNAPSLCRGMRGGDGALASQEPGIMGLQGHIFEVVKRQSPAGIWAHPPPFHCCQMESEPQGGQGTLLRLDTV